MKDIRIGVRDGAGRRAEGRGKEAGRRRGGGGRTWKDVEGRGEVKAEGLKRKDEMMK